MRGYPGMAGRLNVAVAPNAGLPFHVVLPSIALRSRKDAVPDFPHQAGHHLVLNVSPGVGTRSVKVLDVVVSSRAAVPVSICTGALAMPVPPFGSLWRESGPGTRRMSRPS